MVLYEWAIRFFIFTILKWILRWISNASWKKIYLKPVWLLHCPFLLPFFLGGKRKRVYNRIQSKFKNYKVLKNRAFNHITNWFFFQVEGENINLKNEVTQANERTMNLKDNYLKVRKIFEINGLSEKKV